MTQPADETTATAADALPAAPDSPRRPARRWLRPLTGGMVVMAGLIGAVAWAESQGWPFLAKPAERWLSQHLSREVRFGDQADAGFRLSLFGRLRLQVNELQVANPAWSRLGPMLQAREAALTLRYGDLLAARDGRMLNIKSLQAQGLELALERRPNGQASWQFGDGSTQDQPTEVPAINGVHFDSLIVRDGHLKLDDALARVQLDSDFAYLPDAWQRQPGWVAHGKGRYRDATIALQMRTGAVLPGIDALSPSKVPFHFEGSAGLAKLKIDGWVRDLLGHQGLEGSYVLSGPSLAAVGAPVGLTLPTTRAFTMQGDLQRDGSLWKTQVKSARIGRSQLAGEFEFRNPAGELPSLRGELRGPELWLQDLGPAIGVPTTPTSLTTAADDGDRVLPDRPLDLPSLSVMNADVRIKLDRLELGHPQLQSLRPLRTHLTLQDSVLTLDDLDATLAQGRVWGKLQLDARQRAGLWKADLSTSGVRLEQWITQVRANGQPPYVSGDLGGHVVLEGRGRSVAELLASSEGQAKVVWTRGAMSHLAVEAAGLDVAQALGVVLRGDEVLPVRCGAADLQVHQGVVAPKVLVVDTSDSTLWASGSVSLVNEKMDLTARVAPKDVSPLALRTPLHVRGTLGDPDVSLEKGPLARRLVPAVLLGLVHPLAALLPLIDTGGRDAEARLAGCRALAAEPAPAPPKLAHKLTDKVASGRPTAGGS